MKKDENIIDVRNSVVRNMTFPEFEQLIRWCIAEGWNVGQRDAQAYFNLQGAYHLGLVLKTNSGEEIFVGGISLVLHSHCFATIGLFLVSKEYRNQGMGTQLWDQAMRIFSESLIAHLGLYAVPAQVGRYSKSGFETAYTSQRWQSVLSSSSEKNVAHCSSASLDPSLVDAVDLYSQGFFPASRKNLFSSVLTEDYAKGFVKLENQTVVGFALVRPCQNGYRVGPLYANTPIDAKILFEDILSYIKNVRAVGTNDDNIVFLDLCSKNQYASYFAEFFKLQHISETDTDAMFKDGLPQEIESNFDKHYAPFSLEIG